MAYRGKYPRRIQSVWSGYANTLWCRTNDGTLFWINPEQSNGQLPKLGKDVADYPACIEQDR